MPALFPQSEAQELTAMVAYLASLEDMRRAQMEPASDFLLMAATLLQIKSRLLLPRPPGLDDIEADAPEDPRAELVRQLLEYRRYREVAAGLVR